MQLSAECSECFRPVAVPCFWHIVAMLPDNMWDWPSVFWVKTASLADRGRVESSLEKEVGVGVARDLLITLSMHNLFYLMVDEVVEGVDMLLHQPPHLHHAGAMKRLARTEASSKCKLCVDMCPVRACHVLHLTRGTLMNVLIAGMWEVSDEVPTLRKAGRSSYLSCTALMGTVSFLGSPWRAL